MLEVDAGRRTAVVQGMTTYEHLVDATLPHGLVPLCVPQLRTITLGGAVTGLGIESASWRNGLPHESVIEMDVMTGSGEVLTVTRDPDDPHADLFAGFPNSYGSLGYALRLTIELEPVAPYVRLRHVPAGDAAAAAAMLDQVCADGSWDGERVDFVDGTVFSRTESYVTLGRYEHDARGQAPSDRTKDSIYYRSIQSERSDLLTMHDYLWRWDTDWFWCSRAFGAQNPLGPQAVAGGQAALRRLLEAHRARPPHQVLDPARRCPATAAARARRAGHRGPGGPARRVPRLLPPRGGHRAGVAVPAAPA